MKLFLYQSLNYVCGPMRNYVHVYLGLVGILILVMTGCEFRKIQRSGDWKLQYEAALKYYEEKDYYRASVLFEDIIPIIRGTKEAELVNFYYAYSYYYQKQYLLSSHHFKTFTTIYGRSEYYEEAFFMYAHSLYLQSPTYTLDQASTYEAIAALQNYLNKYPNSTYSEQADRLIDELQVKLETKAYANTKHYFKLRQYKAALVAAENFSQDYPDSEYNEELGFLAIESAYNLAESSFRNKQEERFKNVIDRYESFIDKYPNSNYLKQAERFYEESIEELSIFASSK